MRLQHNASLAASALFILLSSSWRIVSAEGLGIAITEIANRGSGEEDCNGKDWVELQNTIDTAVDLTGWKLYDDKGPDNADAWTIPEGYSVNPGEYLVVCRDQDFLFGIGSKDAVAIADPSGSVVDAVALAANGPDEGTYALFDNGEFKYTTTPTPGEANVLTEPVSLMTKLREEFEAGESFFSMDGEMGKVVDIDVTIGEKELEIITDHPAWEEWTPFEGLAVATAGDENATVVASAGSGSIRVRGQGSNAGTSCLGLRNVPFLVEFDSPFVGLDRVFLRNHYTDPSYMRDHSAHRIMKAFGLPYMRTRPARLFINGEYIGFYTVMEPPTTGHFMQRNFGDFDPDKTAIYKFKTYVDWCPYDQGDAPAVLGAIDPDSPVPDPYYFERGQHRVDTPILGDTIACDGFSNGEIIKEHQDIARGWYSEYDQQCGEAMVGLGRVDRDFGPKSTEESMINFLNDYFYNPAANDWTAAVDADDWSKHLAFMAVMLHYDSPMGLVNNFYLATTNGGDADWKIVQYDHNNYMSSIFSIILCQDPTALARAAFWPIMRPTCGAMEDHAIVGHILNSDENMAKYLGYVSELANVLSAEDGVISELYDYGDAIKEYVMEDPFVGTEFVFTLEEYEYRELGTDIENYNDVSIQGALPFLKATQFRVQQVKEQLDAIGAGTLPRNGVYDPGEVLPDWRNPEIEITKKPASKVAEDCGIPDCRLAGVCYDTQCSAEGEVLSTPIPECGMASPLCDDCFPHSRCGSATELDATDLDLSGTFVPDNDGACGEDFADAGCALLSPCFSHGSGICAFDGSILTVDCQPALGCRECYPYSRCGSGDAPPIENPDSGAEIGEDDTANHATEDSTVKEDEGEEPKQKEEAPPMDTEATSKPKDDSGGANRPFLMVSVLSFVLLGLWMVVVVA